MELIKFFDIVSELLFVEISEIESIEENLAEEQKHLLVKMQDGKNYKISVDELN